MLLCSCSCLQDNTHYSCKSSGNSAGEGVSSATHFRVEYPPDNLGISKEVVTVVENKVPEKVLCTAEAYPEASFMWRFRDEVIQTQNLLNFGSAITREQAGVYKCEAQNRHGGWEGERREERKREELGEEKKKERKKKK